MKQKKSSGELYLSFEFGDRSGRVRGTVWEQIEKINHEFQVADMVKVKGKIISYRDDAHLSIEKMRRVTESDNVNPMQFLPESEADISELYNELLEWIASINNTHLKKLLENIYNDQEIKKKFIMAPAAKLWHHNYLGGLTEHTVALVKLCHNLQKLYPQLDRDILIAGAMLHDLGKITELETTGFINYSTEGRLLGHITISCEIVTDKIKSMKNFPENLKQQLLHCILSHHGKHEYGSPVVPMTLEALVLNYADELDSKIAAFMRIKNKEQEPGRVWSNYVNLLDRFLYLGDL
ncbi:HD domain-containing protein [candidate division KSB1 bacterium]|nr:HD domain-containing protein [candidate division KSB1 bacterium]